MFLSGAWLASPESCCGVCVGGDLGGGLFAELDVPAEAAQVQMPGFGLEFGGGASVGGWVGRARAMLAARGGTVARELARWQARPGGTGPEPGFTGPPGRAQRPAGP